MVERRGESVSAVGIAAAALFAGLAPAQEAAFPSRLIVPYVPGPGAEVVSRVPALQAAERRRNMRLSAMRGSVESAPKRRHRKGR